MPVHEQVAVKILVHTPAEAKRVANELEMSKVSAGGLYHVWRGVCTVGLGQRN